MEDAVKCCGENIISLCNYAGLTLMALMALTMEVIHGSAQAFQEKQKQEQ